MPAQVAGTGLRERVRRADHRLADQGLDGPALRWTEIAVLTTANAVVTVLRFVAVRVRVFVVPGARTTGGPGSAGAV